MAQSDGKRMFPAAEVAPPPQRGKYHVYVFTFLLRYLRLQADSIMPCIANKKDQSSPAPLFESYTGVYDGGIAFCANEGLASRPQPNTSVFTMLQMHPSSQVMTFEDDLSDSTTISWDASRSAR